MQHHHGPLGDAALPHGNGVRLWFEIRDFDAAVVRATALYAEVVLPRHRNPPDGDGGPNPWELWLRDLDGYTVVLWSPDGSPMVTGNRDATSRVDKLRLNEAFQPERHHEDRKRDQHCGVHAKDQPVRHGAAVSSGKRESG